MNSQKGRTPGGEEKRYCETPVFLRADKTDTKVKTLSFKAVRGKDTVIHGAGKYDDVIREKQEPTFAKA